MNKLRSRYSVLKRYLQNVVVLKKKLLVSYDVEHIHEEKSDVTMSWLPTPPHSLIIGSQTSFII